MLTQTQALDAVRDGIRRARCTLTHYEVQGDNLLFHARQADEPVAQIGLEYNWSALSEEELRQRVRRFAEHYCNGKRWKFSWGDSLV